jgi:putative glycosyltransferase (TIGR04372 family)
VESLKKIIRKFGGQALQRLRNYGLDVHRVQDIDMQIGKLRSIKDPNIRLRSTEQLVSMHPKHPKVHLELVQCLHMVNDPKEFEQMDRYAKILKEWLIRTEFEELNMEFIWVGMVMGSLGNHYAIEGLLKANKYGLRVPKKIFLLLPENVQLRNPALFSYFEPHLYVIRDREIIQAMKGLESLLTLPLGMSLPMNDICPFLDIAANMAEVQRIKLGMDGPLFHLNEKHNDMGQQVLKKLGLPDDAWYVTMHVREPGYRGETRKNNTENWRNANPLDYLNACEAVTKAGGWVFRLGDPSMTPLPQMPQVIDYAHMGIRSDWMDVFLGATCRFLIGTASGPLRIPRYFGIPVILTNCSHFVQYFSLTESDLYLPRFLKYQENDIYLSFEENMSPPTSMFGTDRLLKEGLECLENTSEELEAATIEMLQRTDGNNSSKPDDDLQRRFKIMAEKCGLKYGGHSVKALAPISREFLHKHVDLLE